MTPSSDLIAGILTLVIGPALASSATGGLVQAFDQDQDKYHASPVEPSLWDLPRADGMARWPATQPRERPSAH